MDGLGRVRVVSGALNGWGVVLCSRRGLGSATRCAGRVVAASRSRERASSGAGFLVGGVGGFARADFLGGAFGVEGEEAGEHLVADGVRPAVAVRLSSSGPQVASSIS